MSPPEKPRRAAHAWERAVYDRVLAGPGAGRFTRAVFRFYEKLYHHIVRRGDPLLRLTVAGLPLWLPFSHPILFHLRNFPWFGSNLTRLACTLRERFPELRLIDVGANVGDSVALLRNKTPVPILCVEGDDQYFALLRTNMASVPDVELANCFLAAPGEVQTWNVARERGTAFLQQAGEPGETHLRALDAVLKDHPRFAEARMLKIDTDGFDGHVLRGAVDYLSRVHPVIFLEYVPDLFVRSADSGPAIRAFLRGLGYESVLVYDNLGVLMGSAALSDAGRWEEIDAYFSGHGYERYADLCVFHRDDGDLFQTARRRELELQCSVAAQKAKEAA
jgi:FkbM family methyltransferase